MKDKADERARALFDRWKAVGDAYPRDVAEEIRAAEARGRAEGLERAAEVLDRKARAQDAYAQRYKRDRERFITEDSIAQTYRSFAAEIRSLGAAGADAQRPPDPVSDSVPPKV